ncbi:MAG: hypothetical protein EGR51_12290 [Oscillibacter sp.]|nr:hypothetical protein [Oscillibacter sp.]
MVITPDAPTLSMASAISLPTDSSPEETAPDPWGLTVLAPGCVLEDEKRVRPGVMLNKNGEEVSR